MDYVERITGHRQYRNPKKLCIRDGRIVVKNDWLGGLLGLSFSVDEFDSGNDFGDKFRAVKPAPVFFGLPSGEDRR